MCSYNRINDTWACENDRTINQDLKGSMGFQVCPVRPCVWAQCLLASLNADTTLSFDEK